jgi:hypothetical protein
VAVSTRRATLLARFVLAGALLLAASGCGGGGSNGVGTVDTGDSGSTGADGSVAFDTRKPDGQGPGDTQDVKPPRDVPDSAGPSDTARPETGGPMCPGDPLCPCTGNHQCLSGWCVEDTDGWKCTDHCVSTCWQGWACVLVESATGGDRESICVPMHPRLCQPCSNNADCATNLQGAGSALCIPHGPEGSFCGGFCLVDEECPGGFACEDVVSQAGVPVRQCVPANGAECQCNDKFVRSGNETACHVENVFGRCEGVRYCTPEGLAACTAKIPEDEVCDGQDNDCSGIKDDNIGQQACQQTNSFGTCYGVGICIAGQFYCDAATPERELCDAIDNDCDGLTDEDFNSDLDGDGVIDCLDEDPDGDGIPSISDNCPMVYNPRQENYDNDVQGDACDPDDDNDFAPDVIDCEPFNREVYPGAPELCDGRDNNCNDQVDEGFLDTDGDGLADCIDPDDDNDLINDPNDNCPLVYNPDQADNDRDRIGDACDPDDDNDFIYDDGSGNGVIGDRPCASGQTVNCDDNCQFVANQDQLDTDGDGRGNACDLDDDNDGIPDTEDNCPLVPNVSQADYDRDGLGDACDPDDDNDGVPDNLDCEPRNAGVYPGAQEFCDGLDNNCNGITDERDAIGCQDYHRDQDRDTYGTDQVRCLCAPSSDYTATRSGDCLDTNAAVHPAAVEICDDNLDNNCNGSQNDRDAIGCSFYFTDSDNDGYGVAPAACLCGPAGAFTSPFGNDCNDLASDISPGRTETCATPYDDNCDQDPNEEDALGCQILYWDSDGDGFGTSDRKCLCNPIGRYIAREAGDCDDTLRTVNPSQREVCGNALDDNCDGRLDEEGGEGCQRYYLDVDGDGFGQAGQWKCLCGPSGQYRAPETMQFDCNDQIPTINPGALEVCNGYDDNCNTLVDYPEVSHEQLCEQGATASYQCLNGNCVLASCTCEAGPQGVLRCFADLNGLPSDGCECELDANEPLGNGCVSAIDLGNIPDTGAAAVTQRGNIAPIGDADWYRFYAVDGPDSSCDRFYVDVRFTANPGNRFQFDVYRGGCAGANQICTAVPDRFSWSTNFFVAPPYTHSSQTPDATFVGGECGCRAPAPGYSPTTPSHHLCRDNSAVFYVRVTRREGTTPTCETYEIAISNGFYTGQ